MLRQLPQWLRRTRSRASDLAWQVPWRAVRAISTPWAQRELAAARAKLGGAAGCDQAVDRDALDRWLREAAPPGVPFEAVVLPGRELAARFPDGPEVRRSRHLAGKLRMTHRAHIAETVVVVALFSDVAADYFVESMAADVASAINRAHGRKLAYADAQAGVPVVLKELATAAGLGAIGRNALFFSQRFGFNCKLSAILIGAPVSRYDAMPTNTAWKLADCSTCNLCVEACPVGAFDDFVLTKVEACDRVIAADYFGPRRDHMCRACITRCPVSNDVLKLRRREGAPHRMFWDNEAQLALAADLFMYRPSFWVWLLQRFYYGAPLPGRAARARKTIAQALSASTDAATAERTRDGWRHAARRASGRTLP
jgi:ferredoxin